MDLTQFTSELQESIKLTLGNACLDNLSSVTSLRYMLEHEMEVAQEYVDPEYGPAEAELDKYKRVRKIYSDFMEEYNALLDANEILTT